jgi:hypothetical protein
LLEARILIDGFATYRRLVVGIASAANEGYLESGLADVVKANLDRDAEMTTFARYKVAEAKTEARRDFAEVDASRAVERVAITADVVLAVERNGTTCGNDGSGQDAIVVAEDQLRAEAEVAAEGKPIEGCVTGAEMKVDADVRAFFLEGRGIAEEICTCAQIESCCERRGDVEAGSCEAHSCGKSQGREWTIGSSGAKGTRRDGNKSCCTREAVCME